MGGDDDLASVVRKLADEFTSVTAIPAEVRTAGAPRSLPAGSTRQLYRITQEALANVYRHSGASRCVIFADYRPDALVLAVEDDGRGFDQTATGGGHGLANMRERAVRMGGTFSLNSGPDRGTRIELAVPYGDAPPPLAAGPGP